MFEDVYYVSGTNNSDAPFAIDITGISYCDGSYHIYRKCANILCMEYIYEGIGTVEYGGRTFHPKKGDVYMLLPNRSHNYCSDSEFPWRKIWFNAYGPAVEKLAEAYGMPDGGLFPDMEVSEYFERMVELGKSGSPADEVNRKAALVFHELISEIYTRRRDRMIKSDHDALCMKEYIDAHIAENISVRDLAAAIFKSPSQATRIFKREYSVTPYEYLTNQRFVRAKSLLLGTNMLVKEIAYKAGFGDEHYFSYVFRMRYGKSPIRFREENR